MKKPSKFCGQISKNMPIIGRQKISYNSALTPVQVRITANPVVWSLFCTPNSTKISERCVRTYRTEVIRKKRPLLVLLNNVFSNRIPKRNESSAVKLRIENIPVVKFNTDLRKYISTVWNDGLIFIMLLAKSSRTRFSLLILETQIATFSPNFVV